MGLSLRLLVILTLLLSGNALAVTTLVANPYPTLISNQVDEPARLNDIVRRAFEIAGIKVELVAERRAFSGSGLLSGKYQGEYAHFSLAQEQDDFLYSAPYANAFLYLASKSTPLDDIRHFDHVMGSRVAAENQLVNTPLLRAEKSVSWARNPTAYDAFKQIADKRADFLLADKLLIDEFNLLLSATGEEPLIISPQPLVKAHFRISINRSVSQASEIISAFNNAIAQMKQQDEINKLLMLPAQDRKSLLDENVYRRMIRQW